MDLGNVWIWIAAFVLWLSPQTRTVVGDCLTGASRLFRGMTRFIREIAAWSQVLLVLALILFFISIWVNPQIALILKIAAIYILVAWTLILWATLAIAAGFVESALGLVVPDRREAVVNALRSPYKVLGIIITILVALGLQVFVWQAMPMYVGAFVALAVIGFLIIEVTRKKPITLKIAKAWFFVAVLIFAGQVVWSYAKPWIRRSNSWPAVKINNALKKQELAAKKERLKMPFENPLVRTLTVDAYKQRYGFEPLVVLPNGQDLPNYDVNIKNIENQEFFVLNESIPDFVKARFGQRRCALIESQTSRTNPTPVRFIVPVDFLANNPSAEQREVVVSIMLQPNSTWLRWRPTAGDKKMKEGLELLVKAPAELGALGWLWGFNDMVGHRLNTSTSIPKNVKNVYMTGPQHKGGRPLQIEIIY